MSGLDKSSKTSPDGHFGGVSLKAFCEPGVVLTAPGFIWFKCERCGMGCEYTDDLEYHTRARQ